MPASPLTSRTLSRRTVPPSARSARPARTQRSSRAAAPAPRPEPVPPPAARSAQQRPMTARRSPSDSGTASPVVRPVHEEAGRAVQSENPNITVEMNTLQWSDFYAKVPNAVSAGAGPDLAAMHIDQLATNAARQVIIPLDEVASALELHQRRFRPDGLDGRGFTRTSATASRSTCTHWAFYANTAQLKKAGIATCPTTGRLQGRRQGLAGQPSRVRSRSG